MEYDLTRLDDEQREMYEHYLNESKLLYPEIPAYCLEAPVLFYVLSGCNDNCFHELEERNKIKSNDNVEDVENDDKTICTEE
jgi:hypothetical protein